MTSRKNILILIKRPIDSRDKNWDFFKNQLSHYLDADTTLTMGSLLDLTFELVGNKSRVYDRKRGFSLDDFDLVVFRNLKGDRIRAAACATFLQARNIAYMDESIQPKPFSKYCAQAIRQHAGMTIVSSVYGSNEGLVNMVESNSLPFGYPIIIKDDNGKKGQNNFIAKDEREALQILHEYRNIEFLIQEYIANEGDYRFLVMGGEVVMVIHRHAQIDSHLNNVSKGARASEVSLENIDMQVIQAVLLATRLEKLDIAGVDVMFDKYTGQHYIIEVNSSPQLVTGAFPELKTKALAHFLTQRVNS